jgi:signal peptidase II
LIVIMEARWGWRSWLLTFALGLLLAGAMGNFIDRIRLGYVVDFVDIGIGNLRWYIFNVADMAVTCFFLTILAMWIFFPKLISGTAEEAAEASAEAGASAAAPADGKGSVGE